MHTKPAFPKTIVSGLLVLAALILSAPFDRPAGQGDEHNHPTPRKNFLSPEARAAVSALMIQDFQGRMKPFDTLSRESVMKITKRSHFDGWKPVDLYLSWIAQPDYWFSRPIIAVRHPGLKDLLGVAPETKHISPNSLYDGSGRYRLAD